MNIKDKKEYGVSPVVGIAVLVAIAVILSALVFTTTSGFMTEQQAPSAGANVTIASESVIEVQLDSVQNADNVYVQSPLGTRYKFDGIGDTVEILNIGNKQKPVVIAEKDGKEHIIQGITPRSFNADYVVNEDTGFSEALNAASSGDTIAVKRGTYSTNLTVNEDVKIVSEHGTKIDGGVTVNSTTTKATVSNMEVSGDLTVNGKDTYLASNTVNGALSTNSTTVVSDSNNLIQTVEDGANTTTTSNSAPTASFTASTTDAITGDEVSFNASGSSDSDGNIASYEWDFDGDGQEDAVGKTSSYIFSDAGSYNVKLTVTDDEGGTSSSVKTITVDKSTSKGLVARYNFESDTQDSTGGFDATDNTDAGFVTGVVDDKAKDFDGDSDYLEMPKTVNGDTMVLSTWVYPRSEPDGYTQIITPKSAVNSFQIFRNSSDDNILFKTNSTSLSSSKNTVPLNTWTHVVCVADGTDQRIYINGNLENSQTLPDSFSGQEDDTHDIGYQSSNTKYSLDGALDDLRIYDRRLTEEEIQSLTDEGNIPPSAAFSHSPESPSINDTITFDGDKSSDTDGSINTYKWDFDGDGVTDATGKVVSHSYNSTGDYSVSLTVTDEDGTKDTKTKIVTVSASTQQGLVAHYELDGDVTDSVASYDGTDYTSAGYVDGPVGTQAKDFDGNDDTVDLPSGLVEPSSNFAYSFWFNPDEVSTTDQGLVAVRDDVAHLIRLSHSNPGDMQFWNDGKWHTVLSSGTVTKDTWHHVVVSYNKTQTEYSVYIDSSLATTASDNSVSDNSGSALGSNNAGGGPYYDGAIDDVRIYDRTVSNSEVQTLYEKGNPAPSASFTASPSSPITGETVSFDGSGSSDDGSISSYEWDFNGDGATDATGKIVSHSYDSAGDYSVSLTVTDDDGASSTSNETISISDPVTSGLVSHWDFDETSGSTAYDSAGSFDGTLESGVDSGPEIGVSGVSNTAYHFTPASEAGDYVSLPDENGQYPKYSWTISAWVKPDSGFKGNRREIFDLNSSGSSIDSRDAGISFQLNQDGEVGVAFKPKSAGNIRKVPSSYVPPTDSWTLVTVTRNSSTGEVTLYADKTVIGAGTHETGAMDYDAAAYEDNSVNIGRWLRSGASHNGFDGRIDEVRLYNRSLGKSEIEQIYSNDSG